MWKMALFESGSEGHVEEMELKLNGEPTIYIIWESCVVHITNRIALRRQRRKMWSFYGT